MGKQVFESKECSACEVSKPLAEFSRHKGTCDGRITKCRVCVGKARNLSRVQGAGTAKDLEAERQANIQRLSKLWRTTNVEALCT